MVSSPKVALYMSIRGVFRDGHGAFRNVSATGTFVTIYAVDNHGLRDTTSQREQNLRRDN